MSDVPAEINNRSTEKVISRLVIGFSLCTLLFLSLLDPVQAEQTCLAIGKSAKVAGMVAIPIYPPVELNYQSKSAIFKARKQFVMTQPKLITGPYTPSEDVFGRIEDGKPWWGIEGMSYYGAGNKSILGPAEESRFIMNPFLLVGDSNGGSTLFDKHKVPASRLHQGYFPFYCQPRDLKWWPSESRAEVTYDARSFQQWSCQINGSQTSYGGIIQLEAINARDLGLEYIYVPIERCTNIKAGSPMRAAMSIPQYIHCGGSCGYPGGCNNMSPTTAELDSLRLTALPARLEIWLWKSAPQTGKEPADMVFVINYQ
jgi:hypothetical protein